MDKDILKIYFVMFANLASMDLIIAKGTDRSETCCQVKDLLRECLRNLTKNILSVFMNLVY